MQGPRTRSNLSDIAPAHPGLSSCPRKGWTLVASDGRCPTARSGHSAVVAKESLYIFGGCGHPPRKECSGRDTASASTAASHAATSDVAEGMPICLGDLHVYDLARQSWSEVRSPRHSIRPKQQRQFRQPVERTCAAMCASDEEDRLFLSGGAGDNPRDLRADLLEFDVHRRTWRLLYDGYARTAPAITAAAAAPAATATAAPPLGLCPCRRIGHAMVHDAERDRLVIFGGSTGFEYFDDTHAFDLGTGVWTELTTTGQRPSPRYKHQAFIDSAFLYVVGGGSFEPEGPDLDVYRLHLAGPRALEWERVRPTGTPPRCRAAHGLAWDRKERAAYIWGGFTSGMELDCTFFALSLPSPSSNPSSTTPAVSSTSLLSPPRALPITFTPDGGLQARADAVSAAPSAVDANDVGREVSALTAADGTSREREILAIPPRHKPRARGQVDSLTLPRVGAPAEGPRVAQPSPGVTTEGPLTRPEHPIQQRPQDSPNSPSRGDPDVVTRTGHGRERWRRRGQRLWRQGSWSESNSSSTTRRRQRGNGRRRAWGQGWTTSRLQGLWGGAPATAAAAAAAAAAAVNQVAQDVRAPIAIRNSVDVHGPNMTIEVSVEDGVAPVLAAPQEDRLAAEAPTGSKGEELSWMSLPDGFGSGAQAGANAAPAPVGRSFHCVFFHGGACYVTGGSDGDRKFGDMWKFAVRETPPPLATLAARAFVANRSTPERQADCNAGASRMDLPAGLPEDLRRALASLNLQAELVL